ncbi:hypothetical protein ACFO3J_31490 [Streptomyces polygonati]|uniref:Uncharacterized protein n=1 Tax=Streptomyces polygonati TaxID=1617087 RepID=A0ABV8I0F3_9ACTN
MVIFASNWLTRCGIGAVECTHGQAVLLTAATAPGAAGPADALGATAPRMPEPPATRARAAR